MCVSNNFIEQQAYEMYELIRKNSLYKVVRAEFSEGNSLDIQEREHQWNGKDFITKVILEKQNGELYSVKPDHTGLRFSKGEITYEEYCKIQKEEDLKGYGYFMGTIVLSFSMIFTLMKLLI